jgi:hypothetical protein
MKCLPIRDQTDEMRQPSIKASGLKSLERVNKPRAGSSAYNDLVRSSRYSIPSWVAIEARAGGKCGHQAVALLGGREAPACE